MINVTRLKRRAQFQELSNKGRKQVCPAFVVLYLPYDHDLIEVGFTASKKIGNAVKRNLAKRRMRALVDKVFANNENFTQKGMAIVLIARYKVLDRNFETMQQELQHALETLTSCKKTLPKKS